MKSAYINRDYPLQVKNWVKRNSSETYCRSQNTGLVFQYTGQDHQFVLVCVPQRYADVTTYQDMIGKTVTLDEEYRVKTVVEVKTK